MSMTNKNILALCTTGYFNDRGCHIRILHVIRTLSKTNNIVINAYSTGRTIENQRIKRTRRLFANETDYIGFNLRKIILDIYLIFLAVKTFKEENIDKVLCFTHEAGILGLLMKMIFGVEYLLDYQGSLSKEIVNYNSAFRNKFVKSFIEFIEKVTERFSERVIYNTTYSYNESTIKNKMLLEDSSEVFTGISVNKKEKKKNGYNILWVGVATKIQGFEEFMKMSENILNSTKNVKIYIVSFPITEKIRKKFENHKERMIFVGKVNFEKLPQIVSDSDLCISTKKESSEGNSKLHLYKEYGKDILALRTRASREILPEKSLVNSYEDMEKEIIKRIKNANNGAS